MMKSNMIVEDVVKGSIAEELKIKKGDKVLSINNSIPKDIIEYSFLAGDENINLLVEHKNGRKEEFEIETELTMRDVSLLVVEHFGDEWWGCRIMDVGGKYMQIADKEMYSISYPNKNVYECAVSSHNLSARICQPCNNEDDKSIIMNTNPFIKREVTDAQY